MKKRHRECVWGRRSPSSWRTIHLANHSIPSKTIAFPPNNQRRPQDPKFHTTIITVREPQRFNEDQRPLALVPIRCHNTCLGSQPSLLRGNPARPLEPNAVLSHQGQTNCQTTPPAGSKLRLKEPLKSKSSERCRKFANLQIWKQASIPYPPQGLVPLWCLLSSRSPF